MSHVFVFGGRFRPYGLSDGADSVVQLTVRWPGTPDPWDGVARVRQNVDPSDFEDVTVLLPEDLPDGMDMEAIGQVIRSYFSHVVRKEVRESLEASLAERKIESAWRQEFEVVEERWRLGIGGEVG